MTRITYQYEFAPGAIGLAEIEIESAVLLMDDEILAELAPLTLERGWRDQEFFDHYCWHHRKKFDAAFGDSIAFA